MQILDREIQGTFTISSQILDQKAKAKFCKNCKSAIKSDLIVTCNDNSVYQEGRSHWNQPQMKGIDSVDVGEDVSSCGEV